MSDDFTTSAMLTLSEAAGELRCGERTVRRYVAAGKLPMTRIGQRVLIPAEAVRALLMAR